MAEGDRQKFFLTSNSYSERKVVEGKSSSEYIKGTGGPSKIHA